MLARFAFVVGFLVTPLLARAAEEIDFGRYHALVIGNNDYEHIQPLVTAVSDAAAVAEVLRLKYGFEVTLKINAKRSDIMSAVNQLRATLTEKDRLLIYYAGHGVLDQASGTGYWLPVDAEPEDDTEWIANEALTRHFKAMSVKHVMVVADSCYSGSLVREVRVQPKVGAERKAWLKRMAGMRVRTALVSGGLEPVLDEGSGGHSVFANAFLGVLRDADNVLDGQTLAKLVSQKVVLNADQTPQYSTIKKAGHEGGEFLFVPKGSTVVVVSPSESGRTDERTMELALWNSVKDSSNASAFEAYLRRYAQGNFSDYARVRIEELKAGSEPAPGQQQTALVVTPRPALQMTELDEEMVTLKRANVREGPSVKAAKVATLNAGARVAITGKVRDADWYRIEREGGAEGFIYGGLLREASKEDTATAPTSVAAEISFWESVKDSNNPALLEAYLDRFPAGTFASVARIKLKKAEPSSTESKQAALVAPPKKTVVPETPDMWRGLPSIRWKMQSVFGSKLPLLGMLGARLEKELSRRSDGAVRLKFFEPGALVSSLEGLNAVGNGAVDAFFGSAGYHVGKLPAAALVRGSPFGLSLERHLQWLESEAYPLLNEIYANHGVYGLPCGMVGAESAGWFRKGVNRVEDLRGLKMRFFGLGALVMQKLGVSTQLLAAADIYPALERGVIDATEFSVPAIDEALGFYQIAKYYYYPSWHQPASALELIVNRSKWNALGARARQFLGAVCAETSRYSITENRRLNTAALNRIRTRGVIVSELPLSVVAAARRAWEEVAREQSAKDPFFARLYRSREAYR